MATEDDEQNPFTRPGFLTAAIVVALVVVLGIVIAIVNATSDTPDPTPSSTSASTTTATPTTTAATADNASVCGLEGEELSGTLTTAPDATWEYEGTTAYPTSEEYGSGATTADGVRYCFQHSPTGAVFATAQALAQGAGPNNRAWADYFIAAGPARDQMLADSSSGEDEAGTRLRIAGFRVLAYDGSSARIDIAGDASTTAGSFTFSAVYELVWLDGDWKWNGTATSFDFASIPDLAGYVPWGP